MKYVKHWLTSDHHYGHRNILHLCNRDFPDIATHDETLIKNHNSIVSESDIVYDLGDFAYRCPPFYVVDCLNRINGQIILLLGNHNKPIRQAYEKGLLNKVLKSGKLQIVGEKEVMSDISISVSKMIDINGQKIFISHYATKTWPNAFRGSICCYGHSHGNLPVSKYKTMDVGVDSIEIPRKYYPVSFEEIKEIMTAREQTFRENYSQIVDSDDMQKE